MGLKGFCNNKNYVLNPLSLSQSYPGYPLWSLVTKSYILSEETNDCLEGDLNGCNADCLRLNNAYTRV